MGTPPTDRALTRCLLPPRVHAAAPLRYWAHHTPARPALEFEGITHSYAAVDAMADGAAAALAARGVVPGDRVAVLLGNCPAFVAAHHGALRLGAVAASISTAWPDGDVRRALAECEPRVLVTTPELAARLESALPDRCTVLAVGDGARPTELSASIMRRLEPRGGSAEPAAILYTSGTTGSPRGVILSHDAVAWNVAAKARYTGIRPDDRIPLFVPLSHCYGQNAILGAAFAAGACVVLQRRFDADALIGARPTMLFALPAVFARLLDEGATRHLGAMRFAFSAADALPPVVDERWTLTTRVPIRQGYGLTESAPFACYNHTVRPVAGTVGTPIARTRLRVVDVDTGEDAATGAVGEVLLAGPQLMTGYWKRPGESDAALRDGWLRTGDLGALDDAGYLTLHGRRDDLVKVGGFRVHLSTVERALGAHPAVREAGVAVARRPDGRASLHAFVVWRDGRRATAAELAACCAERLPRYAVPRDVQTVEALPRTPTGKLRRGALPLPPTPIT